MLTIVRQYGINLILTPLTDKTLEETLSAVRRRNGLKPRHFSLTKYPYQYILGIEVIYGRCYDKFVI
jgi:hypothetical protein